MERKQFEYFENFSSCGYRTKYIIQDFAVFDFLRTRYYKQDGTW